MTETTSTQPAEADSYEITRFNALRHGVLSRYTVLPWEDEDEYCKLLDAFVAEHKPKGPTEEHLVEEMVGVLWRKRRLRLAEAAAYRNLPGSREGRSKMSLYQIRFERPPWAAWFALKAESLLAIRSHRGLDTLFVFALVILPMIAFIALLFLLGSADPTTAAAGAVDATGMLILPP